MRVAYLTGPRRLEIREEPEPVLEDGRDVLVRIERVGVCGSDVHYFSEGGIGADRLQYPASVGHECAGTVAEVGPEVTNIKPGDRVAIDPAIACGQCDQCRSGRVNTCRNLQFMGCPGEAPGAAAEYRVLPAANCLKVPEGLSLDLAVLAEPLSIGLHAVRLGEVYPAARVAVLGAGPIGLSVLICAKLGAPCTVYVTDLIDQRLETARNLDARLDGQPKRRGRGRVDHPARAVGTGHRVRVLGDPACIDQAARLLTPGGHAGSGGQSPPAARIDIDPHTMRRGELVLKNVRRQRGCMVPALRLIAEEPRDYQCPSHAPLPA